MSAQHWNALTRQVASPQAHRRCCSRRIACFHASGDTVRVSFALPYRCTFGQHLCLVGSVQRLGSWDVRQGVAMSWSEGDIWTVDLELHARAGSQVEYKYVVRNGDGTPTAWKPGSNFQLPLQSEGGCGGAGATAAAAADSLPGALRVSDAWDESWRRVEARRPRRHLCKPCVYDVEMRAPKSAPELGERDGAALEAEAGLAAVAAARARALEDLDQAISQSLELLGGPTDPAAPEALAADRVIAANARRALALMKALQASDPKHNRWLLAPGGRDGGALDGGQPQDAQQLP